MSTPTNIIEAVDLTKRFGTKKGSVQALVGLDLMAGAGQVTAVLGPNGAGKSTLVRAVATLLPSDEGRLTVAGVDVAEDIESGLFDRLRSLPIPRATTLLGSAQAAQAMSFMAFPFVFVSSAYVPVHSMPVGCSRSPLTSRSR
jgi:ABC-type multidrug transport system ATPase subunit